jgi:hypothetical protein
MQFSLPQRLLLPLLAAFFLGSCDQELNSSGDQPLVDYVIFVTDSTNNAPLDSVRIRVTPITGDTSSYFTDLADGRLELPTLSSSQTRFKLSRQNFRSLDFVDTVSGQVDTVFRRPIARILKVKMLRLGADSARRTQYTLAFRDAGLERLRKGRVAYTDSLGSDRVVVDGDSDGVVELSGLRPGDNQSVRAEHAGYLGQVVRVNIGALSDSSRFAPGTTLTLLPLSNSISGQVNSMTASGPKGLANAKVVFVPKDSLAIPREFAALTSSQAGSEGWFEIRNVPAVEGEIFYRKNAVTGEFLKKTPLTAEDVLRDGPLATVVLTIPLDSLAPMVDTLPKDTLNPKDTLVFHFNQPVERFTSPVVRLINAPQRIITMDLLEGSKKSLKVAQNEEEWVAGKTYSYEFNAVNAQGQGFTRAGDSSTLIRGTFTVREKIAADTGFIYPSDIRISGFNSGTSPRFDTSSAESSPKGDSTSRFARIAWKWTGSGKHVDSLLVCIKDAQSNTSWTQVQSIPGFEDSTTVDLAVLYSTVSKPNGNPLFPLLLSAGQEIQVKVMYIQDGRLLAKETPLPSIKQEMGRSVYTRFDTSGSVRREPHDEDTLEVSFPTALVKKETAVDFGSSPLKPGLFVGDNKDVNLDWEWIDGKTGRLIYKVSETMGVRPLFRVDVNGMLINGKPVWQRDRKTGFRLF